LTLYLFCGLGLVVAYALLGATWLVMKSENSLQSGCASSQSGSYWPCCW
jgi:cytochrome bd-type quinol oxidase subunit 2